VFQIKGLNKRHTPRSLQKKIARNQGTKYGSPPSFKEPQGAGSYKGGGKEKGKKKKKGTNSKGPVTKKGKNR